MMWNNMLECNTPKEPLKWVLFKQTNLGLVGTNTNSIVGNDGRYIKLYQAKFIDMSSLNRGPAFNIVTQVVRNIFSSLVVWLEHGPKSGPWWANWKCWTCLGLMKSKDSKMPEDGNVLKTSEDEVQKMYLLLILWEINLWGEHHYACLGSV